jgi:hypothetical protein
MPSDKSFAEMCASVREEVLAMAKADAERAKFVRVRVLVFVTPDGRYCAGGHTNATMQELDWLYDAIPDDVETADCGRVWIEADVPLPADIVVEGQVRE